MTANAGARARSDETAPTGMKRIRAGLRRRVDPIICPVVGSRRGRRLRSPSRYFDRAAPVVGYTGWVGHKNFGDEILYDCIRDLMDPYDVVLSGTAWEPLELAAARKRRPNKSWSAEILGGGTLIFAGDAGAVTRLRRRDVPMVSFGTGVRDPEFWFPGTTPQSPAPPVERWVSLLKDFSMVSVRGPESQRLLHDHGISDVTVIGDPAILAVEPASPTTQPTRAFVNLGAHGPIQGRQEDVIAAVAHAAASLRDQGLRVTYFSAHPSDDRFLAPIRGAVADIDFLPGYKPGAAQRFLEELPSAAIVIGQRLHVTVLAAAAAVPFIGIEYRPKVRDFARSMGSEELVVSSDGITPESINAQVRDAMNRRGDLNKRLAMAGDRWRAELRSFAARVADLLADHA